MLRDHNTIAPRVLLDTNVWRRIVDADAVGSLIDLVKSRRVQVLVAPGVVYEMLRTTDRELRRRQVKAVTLGRFDRLMTEVYDEASDLVAVIRARRPQWLRSEPDLRAFHHLRADWAGGHGFWWRARSDPDSEARYLFDLEDNLLQSSRAEADRLRQDMIRHGLQYDSAPVNGWTAEPSARLPGWNGEKVDAWRLDTANYWWQTLVVRRDQASLDWVRPFVDLARVRHEFASWNRLWFYEASVDELPREWLRWTVRFFQGLRKVTPGTPGDNQIATYGYHADYIVSGDSGFVDILNKVGPYAPARFASAHHVPSRADSVQALLELIGAHG